MCRLESEPSVPLPVGYYCYQPWDNDSKEQRQSCVFVQDKPPVTVLHLIQILITGIDRLASCTLCFHNSRHFPAFLRLDMLKKRKQTVFVSDKYCESFDMCKAQL